MDKILIVKPSSLGDILHAFPAAALLREAVPNLKFDWLVHPAFACLLDYMPGVERAIIFKRKELGSLSSFAPSFLELLKDLRRERYDAIIDLQGLFRSASIAFFARGSRLAGYARPKESLAKLFYTERIDVPDSISHAADRNTALVCSFLGRPFESRDFSLPLNKANKEKAEKLLKDACGGSLPSPLVGLIPGARWDTKRWPPSFFAEIVKSMSAARPELSFAVFGAASDAPLAKDIVKLSPRDAKVADLTGKTSIGELVEALRLCSAAVSNDSGPMHIAAAVGTPLVALFGPTCPSLTGPRSKKALALSPELDCIGCMKRYCQKSLCHIALEPGAASKAALEMLCWRS